MNLIHLLPLLDGWIDTRYSWSGTVEKKIKRVIERKFRQGWIINVGLITDDAHGSIRAEYNRVVTGWASPYTAKLYEYQYPPPQGAFYTLYNNTGPGTYGLYSVVALVAAYPIPVRGHVAVDAKLGAASTQSSATVAVGVAVLEIDDLDTFKKSLKGVLKDIGLVKGEGHG